MSGSHSMVQHTRTTVVWPWRTLVKEITIPFSVLVADHYIMVQMSLPKGTGTFLMELEFSAMINSQISTEPEVRWWYV